MMSVNPSQSSQSTGITISKDLYFDDGNIILHSDKEEGLVTEFKIDQYLLLRASPVFTTTFSLPQPKPAKEGSSSPVEEEKEKGSIPIITLHDTSADLTIFLKALYDPSCLPINRDINTVQSVEGILKLAKKYAVDSLINKIVATLERDWPAELPLWDLGEHMIYGKEKILGLNKNLLISEPCDIIRLAELYEIPAILPAAYYHLSRICGMADRDIGEEPILAENSGWTARFNSLSGSSFRRFHVGQDRLRHLFRIYLSDALTVSQHYVHQPSVGSDECGFGLPYFADLLEIEVYRCLRDPLTLMNMDVSDVENRPLGTCEDCLLRFLNSLKSNRQALWDKIPELFMLPNAKPVTAEEVL